jgi:monoamine oxidase
MSNSAAAESDESRSAEVLIVGAGVAGLTAARELTRQGISCRVLEARDRVGGRTLSQKLGHDWIDLGGQWIGPRQERLAALAAELGIATFPQHDAGKKILSWAGKIITYKGDIPWLSLGAQLELLLLDRRIKACLNEVPLDSPWKARRAREWDSQTLETWKRRLLRTRGSRLFLDIVVRAVFTSEPRDLSFLYFLSYLKSGHGLESLISIRGGAQEARFIGGAQQISQRMAEPLAERVVLGCPVHRIEQDADGVTVRTERGSFRGRYGIVAIPPLLAGRIHYASPLPAQRDQLMARMPMGSVIKYVAAYDQAFWRDAGFSGEVFSDTGPCVTTFDDTSHDGTQPALVTFSDGAAARTWGQRSAAERQAAVVAEFVRFFGQRAAHPAGFVEKNWNDDPWSSGCYAGVMAPGTMTDFGSALREPCGRLHWAGTETAIQWTGYIDGAIESGQRAANEVASRHRNFTVTARPVPTFRS